MFLAQLVQDAYKERLERSATTSSKKVRKTLLGQRTLSRRQVVPLMKAE
jgi:hypothetical protein